MTKQFQFLIGFSTTLPKADEKIPVVGFLHFVSIPYRVQYNLRRVL